MLKCFDRHPWLWSTHVWNMFDFAADARDQGGEPGMNHKGLVTFDRKTKRTASTSIKHGGVSKTSSTSAPSGSPTAPRRRSRSRSTQPELRRPVCGRQKLAEQTGEHIFRFRVPLHGKVELKAVAGDCIDTASFRSVAEPNPSYKLVKTKSKSANWV